MWIEFIEIHTVDNNQKKKSCVFGKVVKESVGNSGGGRDRKVLAI